VLPPAADRVNIDEEVGDEEEDEDDFFAAPHGAGGPSPSPPPPLLHHVVFAPAGPVAPSGRDYRDGCDTCLVVPAAAAVSRGGQWVCGGCNLRGDLPAAHPTNMHLAAAKGPKAPAAPPGQSTDTTASSHTAKLEAHLTALAKDLGPPHPLFTAPVAGDVPFSPADAVLVSRKALGASQTAPPTEALLKLVQSGKLLRIAFALPTPFLKQTSATTHVTSIVFGAGMSAPTVTTALNPCDPPALASIDEFDVAMYSTIIPALISRPAALMQWAALARTVHEVHRCHGWEHARAYIDSLLNERAGVVEKLPFADPSDTILRDLGVRDSQAREVFFPSSGQRAPAPATRPRGVCID